MIWEEQPQHDNKSPHRNPRPRPVLPAISPVILTENSLKPEDNSIPSTFQMFKSQGPANDLVTG